MFGHLVRLFVPHHSNNHKPRVLHIPSLISLIALLIVVQSAIALTQQLAPKILGFASSIPPQTVIDLTNIERGKNQLPPLIVDDRLNDAARRKAADMFNNNYWAHISPGGVKPWSFILAAGYNYLHAGENLARDFTNPESAMLAWMASPTHKENILNSRYKNIGVAVADGRINGVETTLIVQMFGTLQTFNPQVNAGEVTIVRPVVAAARTTEGPLANVPVPQPTPSSTKEVALSSRQVQSVPMFDVHTISKVASLAFAILVMVVLAVDWLVVWRKNLVRLSGKSWAHLTFLAFIVLLTLIIKQGWIM